MCRIDRNGTVCFVNLLKQLVSEMDIWRFLDSMDSPGFVLQRNELPGIKGNCLTCNTVGKGTELAANASGVVTDASGIGTNTVACRFYYPY
jgi:hypothetical protein